jgi:16S rRNA (guanine966-N2)-methyltransferase
MRIAGGEYRGRPLASPKSSAIRPTTDRTRESLFNILSHSYPDSLDGTRILDLFSGTGALGIEALSRGARYCLFVEDSAEGRGLLRENVEAFSLQGKTRIFRRDATDLGPAGAVERFDLVFADPPYGKGLGERALLCAADNGWLSDGALIVLEEAATANVSIPGLFSLLESRPYGESVIRLFRWKAP